MSRCSTLGVLLFALPLLATTVSCNRGPAPLRQPSISASSAGKLAMEQYDKDGDGKVAGAELDQAPSLKAALKNLDTDGDGAVSASEVTERVNAWKAMKTALASVPVKVTLDGEPLGGATITFEPESFLGDEMKRAVGTTNLYGVVAPTVAPEDRPDPKLPGGAYFGLYIVRISKMVNGKETIPARYNTQSILGQEVSYDDPGVKNRSTAFALKSGN
jgi:EF hand